MARIIVSDEELSATLHNWIKVAGIKRPHINRQLFNPRETPAAERDRESAAWQLAEYLAEHFRMSKHQVTREDPGHQPLFG